MKVLWESMLSQSGEETSQYEGLFDAWVVVEAKRKVETTSHSTITVMQRRRSVGKSDVQESC